MKRTRPGYTILEVTVAFAILATVVSTIAQLGYWSLRQRLQTEARQAALELADNVLEAARALPVEAVTAEWAAQQKVPGDLETFLPQGKLAVTVDAKNPQIRRVTAAVTWHPEDTGFTQGVRLTTLLASRQHAKGGNQP